MRVFSESSTGAKSEGSGSNNNLFHFPISVEDGAAFVRRSDAAEKGGFLKKSEQSVPMYCPSEQ